MVDASKSLQSYLTFLKTSEIDLDKIEHKVRNELYIKKAFRLAGMPKGFISSISEDEYQVKVEQVEDGDSKSTSTSTSTTTSTTTSATTTVSKEVLKSYKDFETSKFHEVCCLLMFPIAKDEMEMGLINIEAEFDDDLRKMWKYVISFDRVRTRKMWMQLKLACWNLKK